MTEEDDHLRSRLCVAAIQTMLTCAWDDAQSWFQSAAADKSGFAPENFPTIFMAALSGLTVANFASPLFFAKQRQPSIATADVLLSRFPSPVPLYPFWKEWLPFFLNGVLFTACGFWTVFDRAPLG